MNANRWQQIEDLYNSAIGLSPDQRTRYLDRMCSDDPELRAEVESLLSHNTEGENILRRSAWDLSRRFDLNVPTKPLSDFAPGSKLGGYRIASKLGEGGMGVVYKATDLKLGRSVALKLVRPQAIDNHAAARFEREARVLALLNNPHIGGIYGFEEQDSVHYLVLEYVPGETLADRLARGRMPVREALQIARQIAEALEAAHQRGVVHRDLKPANVKVSAERQVKVLDFGLAKPIHGDRPDGGDTQTATALTAALTIIGTPAYMSPEQATGKPADPRSDVWAFGCVLYECLTGKQAFAGETLTDTIAAVIEREPDWRALPANVPDEITKLLRRCLAKDPRSRLRDIGDVRIAIEEALAASSQTATAAQSGRRLSRWQIAAIALGAAIVGSVVTVLVRSAMSPATSATAVAFDVSPPEGLLMGSSPAVPSPDGKRIAMVVMDRDGRTSIWIRDLGSRTSQKVAGTEGGVGPFWSPDGHYLGFKAGSKLVKIDLAGGPPQSICDVRGDLGASWGTSGEIIFAAANRTPLFRVPASGGTPQQITTLDENRHENSHRWPHFLPDGKHFFFTARSSTRENTAVYLGSLDSKETKRLFAAQSQAVYAPPGDILFAREGSVLAQKFDMRALRLSGEPLPVVARVEQNTPSAIAMFATSSDGSVLVTQDRINRDAELVWCDRKGAKIRSVAEQHDYVAPAVSPDGKRLAVVISDANTGNRSIWLIDIATDALTRFTSSPANDWYPSWSHDGSRIAFASDRGPTSAIYQKASNGATPEELLFAANGPGGAFAPDYHPDGRLMLFQIDGAQGTDINLWVLPLSGSRQPYPWATSQFIELDAKFSPDGKWVAYASNATGRNELYVRRFDKPDAIRVSLNGGLHPIWRRDGRELFFAAPGGVIMSVPVKPGDAFDAGTPVKLFQACSGGTQSRTFRGAERFYDVSPDGQRFITSCVDMTSKPRTVNVLVHWSALLGQNR